MSRESLEARAQEAARAVRESVTALAEAVLTERVEGVSDRGRASARRRRTRLLVYAFSGAAALVIVGVSMVGLIRDGDTRVATGPSPSVTNVGPSSPFCQLARSVAGEQPESYVGSREHLADLDALAGSAPPALLPDLVRLRSYVAANVSPQRPDSQLIENWPEEVRAAAERLRLLVSKTCGGESETAAPSASVGAPCLRAGGAEVCARRKGGAVVIEAMGLEPGSTLEVRVVGDPNPAPKPMLIGQDGRPEASMGAVGYPAPTQIEVVGTTESGAAIQGTVVVG